MGRTYLNAAKLEIVKPLAPPESSQQPCLHTDCAVVGAGPAGLSAALWLHDLEVPFLLLEQEAVLGGDGVHINGPINNYLGLPARDGRAFLSEIRRQIEAAALPILPGRRVVRIDAQRRTVELDQGRVEARTLILAMGLRRRQLPLPGIERFVGKGVTLSATTDMDRLRGNEVAMVGGGDGAMENALLLAEECPRVHLVMRGASGRPAFFERVRSHPRIVVHMACEVVAVAGDDAGLSALSLRSPTGDAWLPVRHLVVKIGFVPNSDVIEPGSLVLDAAGYVLADAFMRTSAPGVFVAGDLRNPRSPSLAAAVGDGAVAAREVAFFLGSLGRLPGGAGPSAQCPG
jgi:thioredoxin reductase (NADPH)